MPDLLTAIASPTSGKNLIDSYGAFLVRGGGEDLLGRSASPRIRLVVEIDSTERVVVAAAVIRRDGVAPTVRHRETSLPRPGKPRPTRVMRRVKASARSASGCNPDRDADECRDDGDDDDLRRSAHRVYLSTGRYAHARRWWRLRAAGAPVLDSGFIRGSKEIRASTGARRARGPFAAPAPHIAPRGDMTWPSPRRRSLEDERYRTVCFRSGANFTIAIE